MPENNHSPERNKEFERFVFGVMSEPSEKHPTRNEDSYLAAPEHGVFAVFDGMGGYSGGDVASQLAKETLVGRIAHLPVDRSYEAIKKWLAGSLLFIDRVITESGRKNVESREMGTAGSVFTSAVRDGQLTGLAGTAADTRVWIFRDHQIRQITIDNMSDTDSEESVRENFEMLARLNTIKDENDLGQLSSRDQFMFDNRNRVDNHLGSGKHHTRIETVEMLPGDRVLLSSDGIHDNLTAEEMALILAGVSDPTEAAKHFVWQSKQRSRDQEHIRRKPDDMTAMVIDVTG